MRVLMTTDPVGGVWQYSLALARGLVEQHGCEVALVCIGEPPEQGLLDAIPGRGVDLVSLRLKLEWMRDSHRDVRAGLDQVERLAMAWQPDLVHSNQFCFGALACDLPTVVVAHSDVLSWMACCRGEQTAATLDPSLRAYSDLVTTGLAGASAVVCPSQFMARALEENYGHPSRVIYNGLWPDLYPPSPKADVAVVAGRLWDEAKHAATAVNAVAGLPLQLRLVGPAVGPGGETAHLPAADNTHYLGAVSWRDTRAEIARARFYLATSTYEPFGLAALEAALSGCALLANDTPSYREMWGNAALYYRRNDAGDLRERLATLLGDPSAATRLGNAARARALERYTARRMAAEYFDLYESLR